MSDTPRTEAEVNRQKCWSDDLVTIDANFACQLERELNAAQDRIKRLEQSAQEIDKEWFQVIESILGFHPVSMTEALRIGIERIKKQRQRIKRLEDCAETAWGIIANVDSGSWQEQRADWRKAATRWRDELFHPELSEHKAKEAKP